jgi:hypothetical protein
MTIPTDLFRIAWSLKTVPGIRRLVAGLSGQGGGFDPGRVRVIYMVKTGFSHSTSGFNGQSPFLHSSRPSSWSSVIRKYNMAECGNLQTSSVLPDAGRSEYASTVALAFLVVKTVK